MVLQDGATQEPITTMGGSTLAAVAPPSEGASTAEVMNFLELQLDSLSDSEVFDCFSLLGAQERRRGGVVPKCICWSFFCFRGVWRCKLLSEARLTEYTRDSAVVPFARMWMLLGN